MSRIDDALRRARVPLAEMSSTGVANADVFVSPWATGHDPDRSEMPGPSSARPERSEEPTSESFPRDMVAVRSWRSEDMRLDWRERLALSRDADPILAHEFRHLVATLLQAHGGGKLKTVMITSAAPGDGKTMTALNLAFVLSESYRRRVLLIEGDLRCPAICAAVGLPKNTEGLSDVFKAPHDRKVPLIEMTDFLTLMPAGRPDNDPLSGLTSPRMERLMKDASEHFDWVILDTPPLGAAPDAGLMAPLVDAVLLVVRAARTPHALVQHAVETLGADRILGVVLNGVAPDVAVSYRDYYGHYTKA